MAPNTINPSRRAPVEPEMDMFEPPVCESQGPSTSLDHRTRAPHGRPKMVARPADERESRLSLIPELANYQRGNIGLDALPETPGPRSYFEWTDSSPEMQKTSKVRGKLTLPNIAKRKNRDESAVARSRAGDHELCHGHVGTSRSNIEASEEERIRDLPRSQARPGVNIRPPYTPLIDDDADAQARDLDVLQRMRTNSSGSTPSWRRMFSKKQQRIGSATPKSKSSGKASLRGSSSTARASPWLVSEEPLVSRESLDRRRGDVQSRPTVPTLPFPPVPPLPPPPPIPTEFKAPKLRRVLSKISMKNAVGGETTEDVFADVQNSRTPFVISYPIGPLRRLDRHLPEYADEFGQVQAREHVDSTGRVTRQHMKANSPPVQRTPSGPQDDSIRASSPPLPPLPTLASMPSVPTLPTIRLMGAASSPTPLPRARSHSSLSETRKRAPKMSSVRQLAGQGDIRGAVLQPSRVGVWPANGSNMHMGAPRMVAPASRADVRYPNVPQEEHDLLSSDAAGIDPDAWRSGLANARADVDQRKVEDRARKAVERVLAKKEEAERSAHRDLTLRKLVGSRRNEYVVQRTARLVERGSIHGMTLLKPIEELTEEDFGYVAENTDEKAIEYLFSSKKPAEEEEPELIDLDAAIVPELEAMLRRGTSSGHQGDSRHMRSTDVLGPETWQSFKNKTSRPAKQTTMSRQQPYDWQPDYSQPGAHQGAFGPYLAQVASRFGDSESEAAGDLGSRSTARERNVPVRRVDHSRARHQKPSSTSSSTNPQTSERLTAERDSQDPTKLKLTPEIRQQINAIKLRREAQSDPQLQHPTMRPELADVAAAGSGDSEVPHSKMQSQEALEYAAMLPAVPFDDNSENSKVESANHGSSQVQNNTSPGNVSTAESNMTAVPYDKGKPRSASPHVNKLLTLGALSSEVSTTAEAQSSTVAAVGLGESESSSVPGSTPRPLVTIGEKHPSGAQVAHSADVNTVQNRPPPPPKGIFIKSMSNSKGKRAMPRPIDLSKIRSHYGRVHVEQEGKVTADTGPRQGVPKQSEGTSHTFADLELVEDIARMTADDRAGKLNREQKRLLATKRRTLLNKSPTRLELEADERYALNRRHKYFDPQGRSRSIEDREDFSVDVDHVVADWNAAGPKLSKSDEACLKKNLESEPQQLRREYGLPALAAPLPGDQKHPLHMFEKKAKKLMCRGRHNPAITLPELPAVDFAKSVYWSQFAHHLFEDIGPTKPSPPVKCGMPWCVEYCCEYGKLLAKSELPSKELIIAAAAAKAKEQVETLRVIRPNGVEDFETFMKCVGCARSICGRCIMICGVQLCQQICCFDCFDHKNNACPIHHPGSL